MWGFWLLLNLELGGAQLLKGRFPLSSLWIRALAQQISWHWKSICVTIFIYEPHAKYSAYSYYKITPVLFDDLSPSQWVDFLGFWIMSCDSQQSKLNFPARAWNSFSSVFIAGVAKRYQPQLSTTKQNPAFPEKESISFSECWQWRKIQG